MTNEEAAAELAQWAELWEEDKTIMSSLLKPEVVDACRAGAAALRENEALRRERDEAVAKTEVTYCAYCGEEFPFDDNCASKVTEHIYQCLNHPMRDVEKQRDEARAKCERLRAAKCTHGWRGEKAEPIATPCPACRGKSLFIASGGHLTCANVPCPSPSVELTVNALQTRIVELEAECERLKNIVAVTPLVDDIRADNERLRTRIAKLEAALHQITEGKGRFSESPLVYAENCIEDMKQLALDALKGLS